MSGLYGVIFFNDLVEILFFKWTTVDIASPYWLLGSSTLYNKARVFSNEVRKHLSATQF